MTKKTLITISLLLAFVCILACCSGENFKFDALDVDPMTGDLQNNGGLSVSYRGYTYFVNGDIGTYDFDNTFGQVTYGAICRIKTSYLTDDTFDGLEIGSDDYADIAEGKIEVLAPKGFFSGNSATPQANGLYIFDGRLHYTTPSTTRDKDGNVLKTYLDIMRVDLDGTNTKRLYTIKNNSYQVMFAENSDDLCIAYLDTENVLYSVNLSAAKPTPIKIAEDISACKIDAQNGIMAVTQTVVEEKENQGTEVTKAYNTISTYKPGEEDLSLVITGQHGDAQNVSYDASLTLETIADNYIYFALTSDANGRDGLYRVGATQKDVVFGTVTSATNNTFKKISSENILSGGSGRLNGITSIVFYDKSEHLIRSMNIADGVVTDILYSSKELTLVGVSNNKVYYEDSSLFYVPLDQGEQNKGIKISITTNIAPWAYYEFYNDYVLFLASTEEVSTVYMVRAKLVPSTEEINETFIGIPSEAESDAT